MTVDRNKLFNLAKNDPVGLQQAAEFLLETFMGHDIDFDSFPSPLSLLEVLLSESELL